MSTIPLGINVPTGYWDFSTGTNSFGSLVAAGLSHVPVWSQGAGHTPDNEAQLEARTNVTQAFVRLMLNVNYPCWGRGLALPVSATRSSLPYPSSCPAIAGAVSLISCPCCPFASFAR